MLSDKLKSDEHLFSHISKKDLLEINYALEKGEDVEIKMISGEARITARRVRTISRKTK